MSDPVVHFEMPYEDRDRMVRFYEEVFGWKAQKLGPEMGNYVLVTTTETDVKPDAPRGLAEALGLAGTGASPGHRCGRHQRLNEEGGRSGRRGSWGANGYSSVGKYVSFFDTERNRLGLLQPQM